MTKYKVYYGNGGTQNWIDHFEALDYKIQGSFIIFYGYNHITIRMYSSHSFINARIIDEKETP